MFLPLDKQSSKPMLRQIYEYFQARILTGEWPAGRKLPSTRELAGQLNVSRNVVLEAYELLLAEGYIEGRSGSGTYVAEGARLPGYQGNRADNDQAPASSEMEKNSLEPVISFHTGQPALDLFPRKLWASLIKSASQESSRRLLGYGHPEGVPELRQVLADYLSQTRGVAADPSGIVITSGAVQALQLAAGLLLKPGDPAVVEEPTNGELKSLLAATGASIRSVPADDCGLVTGLLPKDIRPSCIYVTPSHQFPLGGILPIQRRVELIRYAADTGSYILEDDYDSEFRYGGAPIQSLQSLAPDRVIYIGTFSKIMFPALRIGYIVLPQALLASYIRLKKLSDYSNPSLEQLALTRFMKEGHLKTHIYRMKKVYQARRQALIEALELHFGGHYRVSGHAAGLHLVAEFNGRLPDNTEEGLRREKVFAQLLEDRRRILLGYGHLQEEEIRLGITRLKQALDLCGT